MKKSTVLHLRIPFSYYLLPVFLFALSIPGEVQWGSALIAFFALHLFLYPASNGYNSYFDKDEYSIGGLKHPPVVSKELYWVSLVFDGIAILLGLLVSAELAIMLLIYGLISKAYSHPGIRLKKYPIYGWLAAGTFQGYFTLIMSYIAISGISLSAIPEQVHLAGILCSILLLGSYPMTQVYQHEEDGRRGDETISLKLGIRGTFHFTALIFMMTMLLFGWFFTYFFSVNVTIIFFLALTPVLLYFGHWYLSVRKDSEKASYDKTMRLNFLSATALNIFFIWLGFM